MLVEIKDLQIGDEVVISSYSNLKYLKILTLPILKTKDNWNKTSKITYYSSCRCSTRNDIKTYFNSSRTYSNYTYEPNISLHNDKISVNFNGRDIMLVKRESEKELLC